MNKLKVHLPVNQNSIRYYYKMWAIVSFKFHQVSNQCHNLVRKKKYELLKEGTSTTVNNQYYPYKYK